MNRWLIALGAALLRRLRILGRSVFFLIVLLRYIPWLFQKPRQLMRSMYFSGVSSLLLVVVAAFFIGMVLGLQSYNVLLTFRATEWVGLSVGNVLLREVAPVLTALLFAGSAAGAIAAEIGLMKTTGEFDALTVIGISPLGHVVMPHFAGVLISLPLLMLIASAAGILGAYAITVGYLGLDTVAFFSSLGEYLGEGRPLVYALIKSVVFAFLMAWIATERGFYATATAMGVSTAATAAVVLTSLAVLLANFILTAWMFG